MNPSEDKRRKDLWQISILLGVEEKSSHLVIVTKDCPTGQLFQELRLHLKASCTDEFQLFSIGGSIRSSLNNTWNEFLSDYDITDRSTLVLCARVGGGVWPSAKEVEAESRHLKPASGITLTTISDEHPDVFGVEYDGPGVIMRCGHATAPIPLALHCHSELEKGKDEILCPQCDAKWKFALLKPAACLTLNEITEFEQRAHINYFRNHANEMNPCPKCGTFSRQRRAEDKRVVCGNCTHSLGKTFQFCWTCLGEWKTSGSKKCGNPNCGSSKELFKVLANCDTKKLNGIDVPTKRACPNCSALIQHSKGCKHMTCRYCSYEFCFICLTKFPCGTSLFQPCNVATRQTSDLKCISPTFNRENVSDSEDSSDDSSHPETDDDYLETFVWPYPIPRVSEMAMTTDERDDETSEPDLVDTGVILETNREAKLAPQLQEMISEAKGTSSGTSRSVGNDSNVALEPSRKRGPPPPPKPQQSTYQANATGISRSYQNESNVTLELSRKRGPPPPPKPQQSVQALTNRFETALGSVIMLQSRQKERPAPPPKPNNTITQVNNTNLIYS